MSMGDEEREQRRKRAAEAARFRAGADVLPTPASDSALASANPAPPVVDATVSPEVLPQDVEAGTDAVDWTGDEISEAIIGPFLAMGFERDKVLDAIRELRRDSGGNVDIGNDDSANRVLELLMNDPQPQVLRSGSSGEQQLHWQASGSSPLLPQPTSGGSQGSQEDPPMTYEEVRGLTRQLSTSSCEVAEQAQVVGVSLEFAARMLHRAYQMCQQGVITGDERRSLKHLLQEGHCQEACRQLDEADARNQARPAPTCPICFDEVAAIDVFRLGCGHTYCKDCMRGHCGAVAFPTCPDTSCGYAFTEDEVGRAGGGERLEAFREMQLQQAVDHLSGRVECPNPECRNVVLADSAERSCVTCQCGWPPYCSLCRQLYHPRKNCGEVGELRIQWGNWVSEGRQQYHGRVEAAGAALRQRQVVEEELRRQQELEADERYKAANCKSCPRCGRIVQKLAGCDAMKCGGDYHGGNQQDGCGAQFNWTSAPAYQSRVERRPVPQLDVERLRVEGKDSRHFFVRCNHCHTMNIRGPRFLCVHCRDYNLCAECDLKGEATHQPTHVFEILFTPKQLYNLDIPADTEVELVNLVQNAAMNRLRASVKQFLPGRNVYELKLKEPFDVLSSEGRSTSTAGMAAMRRAAETTHGSQVDDAPVTEEMHLAPGRIEDLKGVPARFVQIVAEGEEEVQRIILAQTIQQSARQTRWVALPQGQSVQVFGLVDSVAGSRPRNGELATIIGPYILAKDCFEVRLHDNSTGSVSSASVHPVVTQPADLDALEQLQSAQQEARLLNLDLPVGQCVELFGASDDGSVFNGEVAETTGPFIENMRSYPVRLKVRADEESELDASKALMREQVGVDDLFGKTLGQLIDLWDSFGVSRNGLDTIDNFVEQGMQFLEPQKPEPLTVPAACLQPLIDDPSMLLMLRERHQSMERGLNGTAATAVQSRFDSAVPSRPEPSAPSHDSPDSDECPKCVTCGEIIIFEIAFSFVMTRSCVIH